MNTLTDMPKGQPHLLQRLIIIALASLFVFYHVTMLIDFVRGRAGSPSRGDHCQPYPGGSGQTLCALDDVVEHL
jgi:hypothetical protein